MLSAQRDRADASWRNWCNKTAHACELVLVPFGHRGLGSTKPNRNQVREDRRARNVGKVESSQSPATPSAWRANRPSRPPSLESPAGRGGQLKFPAALVRVHDLARPASWARKAKSAHLRFTGSRDAAPRYTESRLDIRK